MIKKLFFLTQFLLLLLISQAIFAQNTSEEIKPELEQIAEWLGIKEIASQADRVIDQTLVQLEQSTDTALNDEQKNQLRQTLQNNVGSSVLFEKILTDVSQQPTNTIDEVYAQLSKPVVIRARNFDIAMEMSGAIEKYQRFKQELENKPINTDRKNLLLRLDQALKISAIAARLQTDMENYCQRLAKKLINTELNSQLAVIEEEKYRQRKDYLIQQLLPLNAYSYRFMKDEELREYVEIIESDSVQATLNYYQQSMIRVLQQTGAE